MSIFGLMTKKEVNAAIQAVKDAIYSEIPDWLLETARAHKWNMPDPSIYENQADLYRKLSWVLQACQLTGENAAVVKFSVARVISGKEPKDIPNHPFEMLLQNPNPLDSRFEFLNGTVISYKLTGNGYWFLNREDELKPPDELWFIPSHQILPIPDERSYLRGYLYYPGTGAEIFLENWQIVHFRRFNPFNRFLGLSAIEAIALVAQGDLGMQKYNTTLFKENNGRLPSVMTFEQMVADPVWDKIKADTREASKNREMLMLRGVGPGGINWLQNAVGQREMEFLEGRKANAKEIMDTIAPGSYTMLFENATEANSRTGRSTFNDLTLYPMLTMMGEKITNSILPVYGSVNARPLIGHFEDVRVTDTQLELQEQERYEKSHTIDEIREEYYGDDPLGDERGKLMVAQIKPESGGIQKPPEPPKPANLPGREMNAAANQEPQAMKANENSAMIALRIPDAIRSELKAKYSFITAEILNDLHITLVYLGDNRTLDLAGVYDAVNWLAMAQSPIRGELQGVARFVSGEDTDPVVATFDSPQMPRVFEILTSALDNRRIPYHRDHGFIPHMTLAYIPTSKKLPIQTLDPIEITFSDVYFVSGNQWTPVRLSGSANKMNAGVISEDLSRDLARYQRWYISRHVTKAVKSDGTPYQSVVIPKKTMDFLNTELKRCVSEAAVKYVFDQAREKLTETEEPKAQKDDAAILTLADSMNNLALAWKTQNEASTTLAALKLMVDRQNVPQQIVVYPPSVNTGETNLHVSVPEQGAPQVFNSFPIQVEAAPSPDVKVDSPVYIQQTVEPAEMPEIPASNVVVNNNMEAPAPEPPRPHKTITGEFLENLKGDE